MADPDRADELEASSSATATRRRASKSSTATRSRPGRREILAGLGFAPETLDDDVAKLSGGWKMRVALARILLLRPDALLLDEPTNHLDIESILWLEGFLRNFEGGLMMTSHDREFMNRLVNKIVEIDGGELTTYTGNYDFYEQQRERWRGAARGAVRPAAGDAGEGAGVHRALQGAGEPRGAGAVAGEEAREDRARRAPEAPPKVVEFDFRQPPRSGEDVARSPGSRRATASEEIYDDFDLLIRRGERWCVMGVNGAGKSTLLKLVAGASQPDAGDGDHRREREARVLLAARDGHARPQAHRASEALRRVSRRRTIGGAAHARGRLRLLWRRRREACGCSRAERRRASCSRRCCSTRPTSWCSTSPPTTST
jgi:ATPase subunit of ABC transporter with duplicated ATPase domains